MRGCPDGRQHGDGDDGAGDDLEVGGEGFATELVELEQDLSGLEPAMKPSDAYACIARRQTERVEINELEGRITTALLTPYPPGIPLLIPGERFNKKIVDFLKFTQQFNVDFPGFATDVHGLVAEEGADGKMRYYVDCVAQG